MGGFTLIEVLIATFVLALGVLGLIALFAGTARQQLIASETTNSIIASKNAEAVVASNIGSIDYLPPPPGTSGIDDVLTPNVWYPVAAGADDDVLSVDLLDDGLRNGSVFFRVAQPRGVVLYARDANETRPEPGRFSSGRPDQPANSPYGSSTWSFPVRRVEPRSLSIVITTADGTGGAAALRYVWYDPAGQLPANPPPSAPPNDPRDSRQLFVLEGASDFTTSGFIIVNVQAEVAGSGAAFIEAIEIPDVFNSPPAAPRYIVRAETSPYEYRSDRLVSLLDRVTGRPESGAAVSDLGYALMYRRSASSASQLAVFTYSLKPAEGAGQFQPDEAVRSILDGRSPLRRAELTLSFDVDEKQYNVETASRQDDWIVRPGQTLLFAGVPNDPSRPGADLPVRVLNSGEEDLPNKGVIDRAPRARGASFLEDRDNGKVRALAWGIQPTVTDKDAREWTLTPLECRIFQLR
ncbi:MAG: hypothetical protein IBJ11_05915 [Phycisphaerales bacterium]|nr:hypothetical protein [Phycisphaerales bacterium]